MSNISTTSLELVVRTENLGRDLAARMHDRLSDERGQTAAEYMGIILVIAAFIAILAGAGIGNHLKSAINGAIDSVSSAKGKK